MNNDMRKRRRQVAWICFEPHLTENQLITAIQISEHSFQQDSISNLIAYVTKICLEFDIDATTRKSLYGQFHELMSQENDLLIDPLVLINEREPEKPTSSTVAPEPTALQQLENESPTSAKSTATLPPHTIMFSYFMHQLIAYLPKQAEFFEILIELSQHKKLSTKIIAADVNAWTANTEDFQWTEALAEKRLADLVQLVYTALCELLGPIAADDCFHKAIAFCEQKPEARQFPPSRFL
jgi:hypothetical protein